MQPCIAGLLCPVSWRNAGLVGSDCSEWKKPEILMYAVAAQPAVSFPSGQGLGQGYRLQPSTGDPATKGKTL